MGARIMSLPALTAARLPDHDAGRRARVPADRVAVSGCGRGPADDRHGPDALPDDAALAPRRVDGFPGGRH